MEDAKPKKKVVHVLVSQEAHDQFTKCKEIYMKIDGKGYNQHRLFEKVIAYAYNMLKKELEEK